MEKATLVSLAESLGVSRQTISNVINAPHRVKLETRMRVQHAITESGYRPSAAARQLRTRRSMNLGIRMMPVVDGINGSILDRFLHALTEAAQEEGYRLTLFSAATDDDEVRQYEDLLNVADLDGFVLTGTHHGDQRTAWLLENEIPFASFGRPWSDTEDPFSSLHPWVDVDGGAGTEQATQLLLDQGHTAIGFIGWPTGSGAGDDRRGGWRRAMKGTGRATDHLDVEADDGVPAGARSAEKLLAAGATAVVCASDSFALGALATFRGHRPAPATPDVIGFDDTPVATAVGLSSVAQPIEDAARHIIRVLTHTLSGDAENGRPDKHLLLPPTLAERFPYPLAGDGWLT
ncbi:LacI family DNA-binding transcriptional regulator [Arthrobacter sp. HLT1-21]